MIGKIINFAKNIGSRIPIIRNFLPKKENEKIDPKTFHEKNENDRLMKNELVSLDSKNKNQALVEVRDWLIKNENTRVINKKYPEFSSSIKKLISKTESTGAIDFKEKNLNNLINEYQQKLNEKFEQEVNQLNNQNTIENKHLKYLELWSDYIKENKRLMLEAADEIILSTSQLEQANDLYLMNSIKMCREISKELALNSLSKISEQLNNIPIGLEISDEKGKRSYRDLIKEEFQEYISNLYLISKFGLHSEEIILKALAKINKNLNENGKNLFEDLSIIKGFQEGIHFSLIQSKENIDNNNYRIGMIDKEIVKNSFEKLSSLYFDYVDLRSKIIDPEEYQKKKNQILAGIKDIKNFIYNLGLIENLGSIKLNENNNEHIWNSLNVDKNEILTKINNSYKKINWLSERIGVVKGEKILGFEFQNTPAINLLNEAGEEKIDHVKRIILEISVLAGIKVILQTRNKDRNVDLTQKKMGENNRFLPATLNFESLPWLKNFYNNQVEKYQTHVNKEKSKFKIAPIIKELSNIGKELRSSKLFTASDFFARYGLDKEDDELINIIGEMTDIGRMRLSIDFVSNFLSYLTNEKNEIFSKQEINNIKLLINYLSKESKVIDAHGNEIYAPTNYEPEIEKVYEKMKAIVGDTSFLTLNTPLIINFLKKTFGKFDKQDKIIPIDSFETNNQVLASWLFYIIVKFLPEKSHDVDSLKSRIEIYKILMDQNFQKQAKFNASLFSKLVKQARGLEEAENIASRDNKKGVIKALCLDLENHVNLQINAKSNNNLRTLLDYYEEIENFNKNNPKSYAKIIEVQKNIIRNNEPLLKPLEASLIKLYEKSPATVLEFVKAHKEKNPQYLEKLSKDLLNKIDLTQKNIKINNGKFVVLDSDKKTIWALISLYEDIINLGYLFNKTSSNQIELTANLFNAKDVDKQKIQASIKSIKDFMESDLELKSDPRFSPEQEAFENQYQYKNRLVQLAKIQGSRKLEPQLTLAV